MDLSDDHRIAAHLMVRPRAMAGLDFVFAPLSADDVKTSGDAVSLHQIGDGSILMGYYVTPNLASPRIFDLGVLPTRVGFADEATFNSSTTSVSGLTIRSTGVRRHLVWNINAPTKGFNGPAVGARLPDLIAFGLPENFEGRTLLGSSSMTYPTPISGPNPLVIAQSEITDGRIEIAYDLPEPEAYAYVTKAGIRFIGILLAVLLLGVTQGDKVDRTKYRPVFWIVLGIIMAIYIVLIGWGLVSGANITELVTEFCFGIATIAAAIVTNYVQTRNQPPANRSAVV